MLSLKLLLRDWRSGELLLIMAALILAMTVIFSISLTSMRLSVALDDNSKQFLAADRVLESSRPISQKLQDIFTQSPLKKAEKINFTSMLFADQNMQLTTINAVSEAYPLKGELTIQQAGNVLKMGVPKRGEIWLNKRVLQLLNVKVGDTIELGEAYFVISAELILEPDEGIQFYGGGNRALININDVAITKIVQEGSRVKYRYLFAGDTEAIEQLTKDSVLHIESGQRWLDIEKTQPQLNKTLNRAKKFLLLTASLAVGLSGLAIALAAERYTFRHLKQIAILKTLGASRRKIMLIFITLLIVLCGLSIVFGLLAGLTIHQLLVYVLQSVIDLTQYPLNLALIIKALGVSVLGTVFSLLIFTLPSILQLSKVPARALLNIQQGEMQSMGMMRYVIALVGLAAIMYLYTQDIWISLAVLASVICLLGAFFLLGMVLIKLLPIEGSGMASAYTAAVASLKRYRQINMGLMAVVAISFMLVMVVAVLRHSLLAEWQQQLPKDAPNYFLLNIAPYEVEPLNTFLNQQKIKSQPLYPVVMGRLTQVNGESVNQLYSQEQRMRAGMERELSLTWSQTVPNDNTLVAGQWWQEELAQVKPSETKKEPIKQVSVEQDFARRLSLKLKDQLTFSIGAQSFEAEIISIRSLNWQTLQPNFFMIFNKAGLQDYSANYLTSFYWPIEHSTNITTLIKRFPTMTLIDIRQILERMQTIVFQLGRLLELIFLMIVCSALLVLVASLQASMDQRRYDNSLFRALGAKRQLLQRALFIELVTLGLIAGLMAAIGTELTVYCLCRWVFEIPFSIHVYLWVLGPLMGAIMVAGLGYWRCRAVVNSSPMRLLNQQ